MSSASSSSSSSGVTAPRLPPQGSWDCMLPGPPSRNNGGSADCSSSGLLAYGAGSSITIVDTKSMQLITVLPMPPPSTNPLTLTPFVSSIRWTPQPLRRDLLTHEPNNSHLILAVGDRQGRIALWDFRLHQILLWLDFDSDNKKLGIQDLCWIRSKPDTWILASINGPSLVSLWNTSTGRCIWKYDASPEFLSCIRRDPFDFRHFCVLGLKGFLLSVKILGDLEDDIVINEFQIPTFNDFSELQRLEKETSSSAASPALAVFPLHNVKFCFSPQWRHIVFVTFPKEFLVFDLKYKATLFSIGLPRGHGKFMDVAPDPDDDLLYCSHLDGKLSTWRRKQEEQAYTMCASEELLPSIGTSVPSPAVLSVVVCLSESTLRGLANLYSGVPTASSPAMDSEIPLDSYSESYLGSNTHLISITDDGKVWDWRLTLEGTVDTLNLGRITDNNVVVDPETNNETDSSVSGPLLDEVKQSESANSTFSRRFNSKFYIEDLLIKVSLVGQLHFLSSTVTVLAVPSPSLTATLARGGNSPAIAVPLVALGTQNGSIDVIDVSANAVAASFSVHNTIIRGLRWLGNSRLVSFSYFQVSEKAGGYTNRLVVTCLRSGLNRPFRVLQKPERAPIRALRASSSGRYLLILFRDAPVEVWAMTKNPIMLRSLALPFTVLEWTLPTAPKPVQNVPVKQSSFSSKDRAVSDSPAVASPTKAVSADPKATSSEGSTDEITESFSFALVNGALGVFEVHGRRIRDFRPKWPSSSFVPSDGLVTAMAYRLPHVVMGDRSGNIRWWDVTTGFSSSFNTHREGIRRIKFSPVVVGDRSRGRIAVLFYDNTFSIFDLDSQDPLANSLLQPQFPGTLVLELDWLPLRTEKNEPLVLCIAGADSSLRLIEININDKRSGPLSLPRAIKERFRPIPLCSPILLPTPHALALRMVLQLGVKPTWFNAACIDGSASAVPRAGSSSRDLRSYMIESQLPTVGDAVVPELLLKVLEPYRKEGCILDDERGRLYAAVVHKGAAMRFAFAAAIFGEASEALFWLQLPRALSHLINKSTNKSSLKPSLSANPDLGDLSMLSRLTSKGRSLLGRATKNNMSYGRLKLMAFEQEELWECANERIPWHEKLEGEESIQNRVHELVSVGDLEAAVSLLLSTPPESSYFYANALRAVVLSSAVSRSLLELAVKFVAANMVQTDKSLSGTHLLCAVGRHQEACSQLQDAGCWTDAATLAATHLHGSDYARVLLRWADQVLHVEHNIWRALILYVAAGAMKEALAALREWQQADTAAMFLLACHEINAELLSSKSEEITDEPSANPPSPVREKPSFVLPRLGSDHEEVIAVSEYFGQYQRKLVHLCMDSQPLFN
ncbi:hypothetical protein C5167_023760 [Papaver somniferum]|uniref:Uncharacterized protein n=1 Tax=Papaver somniferum TaxID=3469 RepID=A0A4Y7JQR2_PAPSO|nr:WD repeat-containing protein 11-like [Papaver somniferum]RZC62025.1 hypothetical protein C5167_023760 [Papaver somniferum]